MVKWIQSTSLVYNSSLLTGIQSHSAIKATRVELDFVYHAGWKTFGEDDLQWMEDFNKIFYDNKWAFIQTANCGGWEKDHLKIPKLHARHHYPENICWLGASYNYSTEISEYYHMEIAKKKPIKQPIKETMWSRCFCGSQGRRKSIGECYYNSEWITGL